MVFASSVAFIETAQTEDLKKIQPFLKQKSWRLSSQTLNVWRKQTLQIFKTSLTLLKTEGLKIEDLDCALMCWERACYV